MAGGGHDDWKGEPMARAVAWSSSMAGSTSEISPSHAGQFTVAPSPWATPAPCFGPPPESDDVNEVDELLRRSMGHDTVEPVAELPTEMLAFDIEGDQQQCLWRIPAMCERVVGVCFWNFCASGAAHHQAGRSE